MKRTELAQRLGVGHPVVKTMPSACRRTSQIARILEVGTDEILGSKAEARSNGGLKDRRLLRRLQGIDALRASRKRCCAPSDAFISKSG